MHLGPPEQRVHSSPSPLQRFKAAMEPLKSHGPPPLCLYKVTPLATAERSALASVSGKIQPRSGVRTRQSRHLNGGEPFPPPQTSRRPHTWTLREHVRPVRPVRAPWSRTRRFLRCLPHTAPVASSFPRHVRRAHDQASRARAQSVVRARRAKKRGRGSARTWDCQDGSAAVARVEARPGSGAAFRNCATAHLAPCVCAMRTRRCTFGFP